MRVAPTSLGVFVAALSAGCGGSPAAPSSTPLAVEAASVRGAVGFAVDQSIFLVAPHATTTTVTDGSSGQTFVDTAPCPAGGTMTVTRASSGSRTDYVDCHFNYSQDVIVNGDPYLIDTGEGSSGPMDRGGWTATATYRRTGGIRFAANGNTGRAQYDCTFTETLQWASHDTEQNPTYVSIQLTGTVVWQQPIGGSNFVDSCQAGIPHP